MAVVITLSTHWEKGLEGLSTTKYLPEDVKDAEAFPPLSWMGYFLRI